MFIISRVVLTAVMAGCISSCSLLTQPMTGQTLRAALDECNSNELDVLIYRRPDGSVMDVRCIPKPDQFSQEIIVRSYMPMKLLRPVMKSE